MLFSLLTSIVAKRKAFATKTFIYILLLVFIGGSGVFAAPLVSAPLLVGSGDFDLTDGPRTEADFRFPYGMAYSETDNALIIADMQNHSIRKLDLRTMQVTTIAGKTSGVDRFGFPGGGYVDGAVADAMFRRPRAVAVAANGAILVADTGNHAVRQIFNGQVSTVAGNGTAGFINATGVDARFRNPSGIAIAADGMIYVSDMLNNAIRKIDGDGKVTTFAGGPDKNDFNEPAGLAFDSAGVLYVADGGHHMIKKIAANGTISGLAGIFSEKDPVSGYWLGGFADGHASVARFNFPKGVAVDTAGVVYVADSFNHVIRRIDGNANVTTIAGSGAAGEGLRAGSVALFDGPMGIVYAKETLFISDHWNNRIVIIPAIAEYTRALTVAQVAQAPAADGVIPVIIDGVRVTFPDVQPFIREDRVRVPVRSTAETWGATVVWDETSRSFTVSKNGQTVSFFENKNEFFTYEGRAMVQLRTMMEKLNMDVEWLNAQRTVVITSK